MAVFLNDTFTDTDGTALTSHTGETGATWTLHGSYGSGLAVISDANRVRNNNASGNIPGLWYASGTPGGAEYDVEATLRDVTDNNNATGVVGRVATGANTFYLGYYNGDANQWRMYKCVAGTFTLLGSYAQVLSNDTDYAIKLEIRDAAKKFYIGGVERISSADNAITGAGKAGVWLERFTNSASNTAGFHLDNITGTDLTSGSPIGAARHYYAQL